MSSPFYAFFKINGATGKELNDDPCDLSHICNLLIWGEHPEGLRWSVNLDLSLQTTQVWGWLSESGVVELPHTLWIGISSESLLIPTPQICGLSSVWEGFDYYPQESFQIISYFWYSLLISKEVTPIILIQLRTLYCPPQTSMSLYNLWKPLFSHFHTDNPYR